MLTPLVDPSREGLALPLPSGIIMENIVWIGDDGSEELWLCDDGMSTGIMMNTIELEHAWHRVMVSEIAHQRYWPHLPWKRQNRTEQ